MLAEIQNKKEQSSSSVSLWHKAKIKNLETLGEQSATGLQDFNGILVLAVDAVSELGQSGLKANDVILTIDGRKVSNVKELVEAERHRERCNGFSLSLWRNQTEIRIEVTFY